jgi:hypothetical protein
MVAASYERDLGTRRVSLPCRAQNHRIKNTRDRYVNAPRTSAHDTKPQLA